MLLSSSFYKKVLSFPRLMIILCCCLMVKTTPIEISTSKAKRNICAVRNAFDPQIPVIWAFRLLKEVRLDLKTFINSFRKPHAENCKRGVQVEAYVILAYSKYNIPVLYGPEYWQLVEMHIMTCCWKEVQHQFEPVWIIKLQTHRKKSIPEEYFSRKTGLAETSAYLICRRWMNHCLNDC